jgi:hypothetical protein
MIEDRIRLSQYLDTMPVLTRRALIEAILLGTFHHLPLELVMALVPYLRPAVVAALPSPSLVSVSLASNRE